MDKAGVGDRRRPAGAGGDGAGCGERGAGTAAVVAGDQRDDPAMDPRQRGHHLRSRQDAAKGSVSQASPSFFPVGEKILAKNVRTNGDQVM